MCVIGLYFVWLAVSEALFRVSVSYFGWVGVGGALFWVGGGGWGIFLSGWRWVWVGGWGIIFCGWGWVGMGALFDNVHLENIFLNLLYFGTYFTRLKEVK